MSIHACEHNQKFTLKCCKPTKDKRNEEKQNTKKIQQQELVDQKAAQNFGMDAQPMPATTTTARYWFSLAVFVHMSCFVVPCLASSLPQMAEVIVIPEVKKVKLLQGNAVLWFSCNIKIIIK